MLENNVNDKTRLFAAFAGNNLDIWKDIIGQKVNHTFFGSGKVINVELHDNGNVYIKLSFDGQPENKAIKEFNTASFLDGTFQNLLPPEKHANKFEIFQGIFLQEEKRIKAEQAKRESIRIQIEQQKKDEIASKKHFADLKRKYQVFNYQDASPISPLYKILVQLDSGDLFLKADTDYLERMESYNVLALYYESRYRMTGNVLDAVMASKFWRRAKLPEKALKMTEGLRPTNNDEISKIYTTRGGAYRDLKRLTEAEACAHNAIKYRPGSYYPYNLLGAIYYQKNMCSEGDKYFAKAIELGSGYTQTDNNIRNAIKNAEYDNQEQIAQYLLNKDPIRYKWARSYIR
ncbi:MAG: hypothetical protein PHT62_05755 [Desulfotomaculaceae bacterium]|nr:hypothetical protein [Desulfotomaculaceae bacterium]